jgi:hypothetical protein
MAAVKERQTSFAGGEFDPRLWGRTDYQRYAVGAKRLHNFFVEPSGALSNRPGTQFIANLVKIVSFDGPIISNAWLVPFVFSDGDAILVVHLHREIRFFRMPSSALLRENNGNWNFADWAIAIDPASSFQGSVGPPSPFLQFSEYSTSDENELPAIRTAQVGNILTHVHPNHPPYNLRRTLPDGSQWSLEQLSFDAPAFPSYGGVPRVRTKYVSDNFIDGDFDYIGDGSSQFPAREWQWAVTRVLEDSRGRLYETAPFIITEQVFNRWTLWRSGRTYVNFGGNDEPFELVSNATRNGPSSGPILYKIVRDDNDDTNFYGATGAHVGNEDNRPTGPNGATEWETGDWTDLPGGAPRHFAPLPEDVVVYPERAVTLTWRTYGQFDGTPFEEPSAGPDDPRIVATRIYRGQEGRFGFIGETKDTSFVDEGAEPDLANPPPAGVNPFAVLNQDGGVIRVENPRTVAYWQNRRIFGGTTERPAFLWGSAVDEYNNFDPIIPADDADSWSTEIASKKLESIRGLVPRRELLIMSASSEWALTGSNGELVTPNSIAARATTKHGCAEIDPVEVQNSVLFMSFKGTIPWAIVYSDESGGYREVDISKQSRHLFRGHTIISWAYAEDPYGVLWVVRDDGVLLSLTISLEDEMVAWAQHEIAGGTVECVATIPEGTEDGVYLVVNRTHTASGLPLRSLERMATRELSDIRRAVFLDGSITKGLSNTGETLEYIAGETTVSTETTVTMPTFTFRDAAGAADAGAVDVGDVLHVEDSAGGEPGRLQVAENIGAGVFRCAVLATLPAGVLTGRHQWTKCFSSLTNLDHLEGREVMAVLDGNVAGPFTVSGGSVNFTSEENPVFAAIATVGLAYSAEFESLDIVADKTRRKIVKQIHIETDGARGGEIGPILDDKMEEIRPRKIEHAYAPIPLQRDELLMKVSDQWKDQGSVAYRQSNPLPITILGITRDVEVGG